MYGALRRVLKKIGDEYHAAEAQAALSIETTFLSFEFVFMAHVLQEIFGYTDDLSRHLQKQDEDIVHAIQLVDDTKFYLEALRSDVGWDDFLTKVTAFCRKHNVKVLDMEGPYSPVGRPRRGLCNGVTNYQRFKVDMFVGVIDRQISELNSRFDEVNTELLSCMAAFSPVNLFAAFDQKKLVKLATKFYASDFTSEELTRLSWQLNMYVANVRRDERFQNLKNLCELSVMLVKTKKHEYYPIVYKLLKLVLILPVATADVERAFSSMSYLKNKLRNKMGDDYLNNCMVTFVERDFFRKVKDEDVINRFQKGNRKVIM
jgi:hypothetical protein